MFSPNAFDGLENLQELHLNYLYFNVLATKALDIFRAYNSLKVLNLGGNAIQDDITHDQLCLIASLETIDLSENRIYSLPQSFPCNPKLKTLLLNNSSPVWPSVGINLVKTCHNAPTLNILDASSWFIQVGSCTCPKLTTLNLNEIEIWNFIAGTEVTVPNLQRLHMANLQISSEFMYAQNIIKTVLNTFKSQSLQFLDLHSNPISAIGKEEAMLLVNLTWLDLSNNQLVSLSTLQNLNHEDGVPRYDAYVIYHGQDEDWVDGELLANIEEGEEPFRLCLKTRDIRAGRLILNELSLHIQRSRKVIAILSPHFVDDNWCHFELNMAHRRLLEENPNVLIFILLEELPQRRLTLLLRQLFCRVLCLKWPADGYGQYLFWQCLREELKRPVPLDRRYQI
ncbi:toll-like receptor 2 type-2 [Amphiura filiformis]|uniref:toll-like receptor 2 type-2 n=1 Tax=Amphiura filiformis TaxID=82378 RepID=UPI003B225EF5